MPTLSANATWVSLLDVDPDLAWRLREDDRVEARERVRLPLTTVPVGSWSLTAGPGARRAFGMIVVDGVLLHEVLIAGRQALQILGPGDIVLPRGTVSDALDVNLQWTAAVKSRVAVLDDRLQAAFSVWPGLAIGLTERAGQQLARASVQTAIAQLPRVDQRLEATFWQLADRWGRVTPAGIHIPLTLSHETLARLVGGRRPTISLALSELAGRGVVVRHPDRTWMLVAQDSTLPVNTRPVARPTIEATADTREADVPLARETWSPDAAQALLEDVREMRATTESRRQQLMQDLERYAAVRARSAQLRDEIAARRAGRFVREPAA